MALETIEDDCINPFQGINRVNRVSKILLLMKVLNKLLNKMLK